MFDSSPNRPFRARCVKLDSPLLSRYSMLMAIAAEQPWEWMGTPDVAKYLGVTLRTVYRLIDLGELPAYQLGRVIRCRKHEVDAYLDRKRISPGDITERHRYMGKDAWRWTSTEE